MTTEKTAISPELAKAYVARALVQRGLINTNPSAGPENFAQKKRDEGLQRATNKIMRSGTVSVGLSSLSAEKRPLSGAQARKAALPVDFKPPPQKVPKSEDPKPQSGGGPSLERRLVTPGRALGTAATLAAAYALYRRAKKRREKKN